jgi:hypothetical protein
LRFFSQVISQKLNFETRIADHFQIATISKQFRSATRCKLNIGIIYIDDVGTSMNQSRSLGNREVLPSSHGPEGRPMSGLQRVT